MTALGDQELLVILNRARMLLSDPRNWSQKHYAEDETGRWTPVGSSAAVRFNLEGALVHAAGRDVRGALPGIFQIFGAVAPDALARIKTAPTTFTHAEVLSLLDEAMASLSAPSVPIRSELRPRAAGPEDARQPKVSEDLRAGRR